MCAWIAALAGAGFVIRSLTYGRPIVDLRAFASHNFTLGCWFSFVMPTMWHYFQIRPFNFFAANPALDLPNTQ